MRYLELYRERKKGQMERLLDNSSLVKEDDRRRVSVRYFDELLSFEKERQKPRKRVFGSVPQGEAFDLLFIDKMRPMTRLRRWPSSTARFYGLGVNWTKNEIKSSLR
jgi:hypothetical protein